MLYEAIIKSTLLYFSLYITQLDSHLKDMGEITRNWTNILYKLEKRIIGGTNSTNNQFPFSVQFFNFGGLCGGTILTQKTVLTAAHCFDNNKNLAEMRIFSKSRHLFDLQADWHEVWHFEIHQDYGLLRVFSNDIAIILIHDTFNYSAGVQKAVFTGADDWMKENESFVVNGWGETKYGEGVKINNLKKADLYFVSRQECMAANQNILGPEMFCLRGYGTDTCRGDSGGGVLWKGALVGIVSHGRGCGKAPGIYVNVNYYRFWINKTIVSMYKNFCDFHENKFLK